MVLLISCIILFLLYAALICFYWISWRSIPVFESNGHSKKTSISVVIAARNEEANIKALLEALDHQTYPKQLYEVIVVDDHSSDDTARIVSEYAAVKLISLKAGNINSYKKKAIETGIAAATGEWIVTTDADCTPNRNWLETIVSFKENHNPVIIAAPVVISCNSSVLQIFQALDFMVLQGITGAAVYKNKLSMCNGANLAYEKNTFFAVNGFEGIDHIASGDDMLLMHKIWTKYPDQVHYLKSTAAIISTTPMKTWGDFFNQRIRWASKAREYQDKRIFPVLLLVYLFNLSFLVLLVAGFFNQVYWIYLLILLLAKTIIEFPFFYSLCKFFNKSWAPKMFLFFQPLHIAYTVLAGLLGQIGKYSWKDRKVK
jgi:poly-beta-1,6-N-acetyl-D-glucosamine synthase